MARQNSMMITTNLFNHVDGGTQTMAPPAQRQAWRNAARRPRRVCGSAQAPRPRRDFVVIGVDFSAASIRAIEVALRHALDLGSPALLVHVIESTYAEGFGGLAEVQRLKTRAKAAAKRKLERLIAAHSGRGVQICYEIREGTPERELVEAAHASAGRILAVGRAIGGPLSRMLLGSVQEKLSAASPVPLLIVPEQVIQRTAPQPR